VTIAGRVTLGLLVAAIVAGIAGDMVPARAPVTLAGYRVVAADFHTHSSTWSDGALTPWGLVLEARRQGLDAIAITGHHQTLDAKWGRWFSERIGGPTVLVGEEIPERRHHLIAVGIHDTIDGRLAIGDQIDEVHRQGGVAIAAHPLAEFWPGFAPVMDRLDGTEICHPAIYESDGVQATLTQFAARTRAAAIGSSDFHGPGRLGLCRTFIFARDNTADAIVEAIRAGRTVVYGRDGTAYGDPELVRLAAVDGRLAAAARPDYPVGWLDRASRVSGMAGLAGLIVITRRRRA
jgi:hypothetical protein